MQEDRFFTAVNKIVQRVLNEITYVDYRALYPARVIRWENSGINPSGTVDVVFDDASLFADGKSRLVSKTGIPVLPTTPGLAFRPTPGTRCLVGWQGADERFPYATGWLGQGGVDAVQHSFADTYTFDGTLVDVVGDLKSEHELGRSAGALSVLGNPPAVVNASVDGDDTVFDVTFDVADMQTLTSGSVISIVTLAKDFATAPRCAIGIVDAPWPSGAVVTYSSAAPRELRFLYRGITAISGPITGLKFTAVVRGNG